MKKKEVLVIIPAYNEQDTIKNVLDQLEKPEIAEIADVLVMNDASSDATNWIVKARGHALVSHVFNLGYGSGLQLGYKYAIRKGYQYVIQMDADGQHDVCNIPVIYDRYCAGFQISGREQPVSCVTGQKDSVSSVPFYDEDSDRKDTGRSDNWIAGIKP